MFTITKAVFENKEHTAMTVYISGDGFENMPYGVNLLLEDEDDTSIHKELCERYRNGEFTPDPYVEPPIDIDVVARDVRRDRDKRISSTDYLLMTDYPISDADREAVKAYRQALRDITKQNGFPLDVVWPEKPAFIK